MLLTHRSPPWNKGEQRSRGSMCNVGWHLEEIHVTWAHLEKKQSRLRLYTKYFEETMHTEHGDGVAITKRRCQDFHIDGFTNLATASERSRIKVDQNLRRDDGVRAST
ncbi:hypothetical protein Tco_0191280 [Tanacetum coccineum]